MQYFVNWWPYKSTLALYCLLGWVTCDANKYVWETGTATVGKRKSLQHACINLLFLYIRDKEIKKVYCHLDAFYNSRVVLFRR